MDPDAKRLNGKSTNWGVSLPLCGVRLNPEPTQMRHQLRAMRLGGNSGEPEGDAEYDVQGNQLQAFKPS